jgi:osmotically-inducible protein OsmY
MKTALKDDIEIKNDVLSELEYEPSVNVTDIGVLVKNGVVTLTGYATSYLEKKNAIRAAKRVSGVNAIADEIEVKLLGSMHLTDGDIAAAAANQLSWLSSIPAGAVAVTVHGGYITLEGTVEWWYQKNAAENAVHHLEGVKGVTNMIKIKPKAVPAEVQSSIIGAFKRSAVLDAHKISVKASGSTVTLSGKVRNHSEKEEAERAAWAAPGVMSVENHLLVAWPWEIN